VRGAGRWHGWSRGVKEPMSTSTHFQSANPQTVSARDLKHAISGKSKMWSETTARVVGLRWDWIRIGDDSSVTGSFHGVGECSGTGWKDSSRTHTARKGRELRSGCRHSRRGKHQHARICPESDYKGKQLKNDIEISFP